VTIPARYQPCVEWWSWLPITKYAWNNLGRAYLGLDSLDLAMAAFRRQTQINPYDEFAHNNLGLAFERLGATDSALAAFKRQLAVNPLDQFANPNLGRLLYRRERYEEALPYLERSIKLDPAAWSPRAALIYAHAVLDQFDEALDLLRNSDAPDSVVVPLYDRLTSLLFTGEDFESAYMLGQEVTDRFATNAEAWAVLARAALGAQKIDVAKSAYRRVLELDPKWMDTRPGEGSIWDELQKIPSRIPLRDGNRHT